MKKLPQWDVRALNGTKCRNLRRQWMLDVPTLAGRADVGIKQLQAFEKGHTLKARADFRVAIGKALRQLIVERAQEAIATLGAQIAADPDAQEFTREAAARRRIKNYQSYSTAYALQVGPQTEEIEQ